MFTMGLILSAVITSPNAEATGTVQSAFCTICLERTDAVAMTRTDPPGQVQRRLKQLTGKDNWIGVQMEPDLSDPSSPELLSDGRVRVTGTSLHARAALGPRRELNAAVWSGWDALLRGEPPSGEILRLYQHLPDGRLVELNDDESLWDITIERWSGRDILWGGALSSPLGAEHAVMWQDNWTRRVWPFLQDETGRWIRCSEPLFGASPPLDRPSTYLGHTYGHHFIEDETGQRWVFYEKVSETTSTGAPRRTELYARPMVSATRASEDEHLILTTAGTSSGDGAAPLPSTVRETGDALVEGARPVRVMIQGQAFYLLGFSAGEFRTATYGIHFAVSRDLLGPYHPYLTEDGEDFLDFGAAIRRRYGLSWGPARPVLFQDPRGAFWILFHATQPSVLPTSRDVYLAPVEFSLDEAGLPGLTLADRNPDGAEAITAHLTRLATTTAARPLDGR